MTTDDLSTARLDVSVEVLTARLRSGRMAEYAHLLHDADPDSTVPAFPDLAKGRSARDLAADFTRSISDGFVTPITWDDSADCEPAFAPKPTTNMQTGGAL